MVNVSFCRLGRIIPEPFAGYILPYVRKMIARTDGAVPCTVLGAIWNGLACAAAVVTWNEEERVGELRSLFVDPKARGCGVAGRMLDLLLEDTNFSPYNTKVTFDENGKLSEFLYTYSPWN